MADVVLTSALRGNLQALQLTQALIDSTQLKLSTGKKVNSALDSPQNFFAAQSLSNRASDLTRLLDGIGQSIQTVKAADKGVTSLTKLIEQAESVANTAREKVGNGEVIAGVQGSVNLKDITDLTASTSGIQAGDSITLTVIDDDNDVIQVNDVGGAAANTYTVTFRAAGTTLAEAEATSTAEMLTAINGITRDSDDSRIFDATLDSNGYLKVTAREGYTFRMTFEGGASEALDRAVADSLGLAQYVRFGEFDGGDAATTRVGLTASNKATLTSLKFTDNSTSTTALRNATLANLRDDTNTARFVGDNAADNLRAEVFLKNGTRKQVTDLLGAAVLQDATVGQVIDAINGSTTLNDYIKASYDETTGQFMIEAIDADVLGVGVGVTDQGGGTAVANFGFGAFANTGTTQMSINPTDADSEMENIFFAQGSGELTSLKSQYSSLLDQIDTLVDDSGYAGVNLLAGDTLKTYFNEDRSSKLETEGQLLKYGSLGLTKDVNFGSLTAVESIITKVKTALDSVRDFGATLANDLSVIQTREEFTKNLVETLTEGSDKLTLADQNEEGAKLLSLQTRQQLGVTALSLAAQSQQAILRLF